MNLTAKIAEMAAPIETGITRSAVTLTWECGHELHRTSGERLYASCPFCYAEERSS